MYKIIATKISFEAFTARSILASKSIIKDLLMANLTALFHSRKSHQRKN
jgi:hypothetical protein